MTEVTHSHERVGISPMSGDPKTPTHTPMTPWDTIFGQVGPIFINFQQLCRDLLGSCYQTSTPIQDPDCHQTRQPIPCLKSVSVLFQQCSGKGSLLKGPSEFLYSLSSAHLHSLMSALLRTASFSCIVNLHVCCSHP